MNFGRNFAHRWCELLERRRLLSNPADLDPAFGTGGKASLDYVGSSDDGGSVMAVLPDGRILVGADSFGNDSRAALVKYLPDGQLDSSFGSGGTVRHPLRWELGVEDLAVFPDGSFIGTGSPASGSGAPSVMRFIGNGAIDPAWVGPGTLTGAARAILPLSGGQSFLLLSNGIVKLQANGARDTSFGSGGVVMIPQEPNFVQFVVYAAAQQTDGSLILAGERLDLPSGQRRAAVRRYSSGGQLDTNFGTGGTALISGLISSTQSSLREVKLQGDGKIVVAGYTAADSFIARFTTTGSLDSAFGGSGVRVVVPNPAANDKLYRLVISNADGAIFGGGIDESGTHFITKLTAGGGFDNSFDGNGILEQPFPASWLKWGGPEVGLQPDGKLLMANGIAVSADVTADVALTRFTASGAPDTSFAPDGTIFTDFIGSQPQTVGQTTVQPDGKILFTGGRRVTTSNFLVGRLNADGTTDTSFGSNGVAEASFGGVFEAALATAVQSTGKIVVAGRTDSGSFFQQDFALTRLNTNGTLDTGFGNLGMVRDDFGGESEIFFRVLVQPDDKIVAAGIYSLVGTRAFAFARYLPDGAPDPTFGNNGRRLVDLTGSEDAIGGLYLDSNGKILLAGHATASVATDRVVVRLNQDGTPDASFGTNGVVKLDSGSIDETGVAIVFDASGAIFVIGTTSGFNTQSAIVTKLTSGGTVDGGFATGGNATVLLESSSDDIYAAAGTSNGKLLLVGRRALSAPQQRNFLVMRLDGSTGQLDPTFGTGGRMNYDFNHTTEDARDVHVLPGGQILVTGITVAPETFEDWAVIRLIGDTDNIPPTVAESLFEFETRQAIKLTFSEDVLASVAVDDLVVQNLTTGQTLPTSAFTLSTSGATGGPFTATWTYNAGVLADGNYRATLPAGSVVDPAGNPLATDHVFDFFFLSGDANRDGRVNLQDFNRLATNFGQSPRTFSQGDFNYDGVVNLQDFNRLAINFGRSLGPGSGSSGDEADDTDEDETQQR